MTAPASSSSETSGRQRPGVEPGLPRQLVEARGASRSVREHALRRRGSSAGADTAAGSTPSASSTSAGFVTGVAPRRIRSFVPADSADVISPGTAKTSRPSSSAKSAVISAPLRSLASTTTTAADSPAMIRFLAGKRHGAGSTPGPYSDDDQAGLGDVAGEPPVRRRVVAVDAAAEHGDGRPARVERASVRLTVDPPRQSADDHEPGRRELACQRAGDVRAVRGARAGADDADRGLREQVGAGRAAQEEAVGRVVDRREQRRQLAS